MLIEFKTDKSLQEVLENFEKIAEEQNFSTLGEFKMHEILKEKGNYIENKFYIIELCNPKYAQQMLTLNPSISPYLPCRVSVYTKEDGTFISTILPTKIMESIGSDNGKEIAEEMETLILEMMKKALN